jgi:LPS-assembly lipoprotein
VNLIRQSVLLLLFTLGAASCGFTPVYAPGSKAPAELSEISVAPPKNNRANFLLVAELENRIGRNLNGNNILEHNISLSIENTGLFNRSNRAQLIGNITYSVVSTKDGRSLYSGSVENFVTFVTDSRTTTSPFDDALERLVSILVDQIITNLMAQVS